MGTRTPADLRERAVADADAGLARSELVRAYGVSLRCVECRLARERHGEPLADRPRSGGPPNIAPGQRPALAA